MRYRKDGTEPEGRATAMCWISSIEKPRLAMGKNSFYGVRVGRVPGVYSEWNACMAQTDGYSGAIFRGFRSHAEAEAWVRSPQSSSFAREQSLHSGAGSVHEERGVGGEYLPCISPVSAGAGEHQTTGLPQAPLLKRKKVECWRLWFDGSCRGNPGPAGGGAVLQDEHGKVVYEISTHFGCVTNNVAEYRALICGMRTVVNLGVEHLRCCGDSQLVCCQVNGEYRVGVEMAPYHREVLLLSRFLQSFRVHWIPRVYQSLRQSFLRSRV